jgi:hypothetical protein
MYSPISSYSRDTKVLTLGKRRKGREVDNLLPSSVEVKNEKGYTRTFTPLLCLQGVEADGITFSFKLIKLNFKLRNVVVCNRR